MESKDESTVRRNQISGQMEKIDCKSPPTQNEENEEALSFDFPTQSKVNTKYKSSQFTFFDSDA